MLISSRGRSSTFRGFSSRANDDGGTIAGPSHRNQRTGCTVGSAWGRTTRTCHENSRARSQVHASQAGTQRNSGVGQFLYIICNCIVPMGFLPWEIRVAFPGESQQRQSRTTQPKVHAGCFSVSIIHRTLTWTTGSLTYAQLLMHAIAHEGVRTP